MKKKLSIGFVFAMILALLSVAALAAGLLLSGRADAVRIADQALEKTYGITAEMHTFFGREEEELPDGAVRVSYTGVSGMEYVLGTYTAIVRDGKAEIAWSRDGSDVSGGYDAEAWGAEQLKQMIADSRQAETKQAYIDRARAIALSRNALQEEPESSSEEDEHYGEKREADKTAAMNAREIPEEDMIRTAKDFIVSNYGLNEEQAGRLELYTNSFGNNWEETDVNTEYTPQDCGNTWYEMVNGKPCFQVEFLLYEPVTTEMMERGEEPARTEMDGFYNVFVNVETGEIEEYEYNSALSGLG
ncbi:MAG: hypothetical protein IKE81_07745 [Clostridia bacterium]|nr:hypothetical protein [Clostridia bacterium]